MVVPQLLADLLLVCTDVVRTDPATGDVDAALSHGDNLDRFLNGRGPASLVVPVGLLRLFRSDNPRRARCGHLADALVALGWLVPPADAGEATLDAREVTAELGMSVTHARRPIGTRITAVTELTSEILGRAPTTVRGWLQRGALLDGDLARAAQVRSDEE